MNEFRKIQRGSVSSSIDIDRELTDFIRYFLMNLALHRPKVSVMQDMNNKLGEHGLHSVE